MLLSRAGDQEQGPNQAPCSGPMATSGGEGRIGADGVGLGDRFALFAVVGFPVSVLTASTWITGLLLIDSGSRVLRRAVLDGLVGRPLQEHTAACRVGRWVGLEDGVDPAGAQPSQQAGDEVVVEPADQLGGPTGQLLEGAVAQH